MLILAGLVLFLILNDLLRRKTHLEKDKLDLCDLISKSMEFLNYSTRYCYSCSIYFETCCYSDQYLLIESIFPVVFFLQAEECNSL